jgi:hypothetical protein
MRHADMKRSCRLLIRRFHGPLVLCGAIPILLMSAASCRKAIETRQPAAAAVVAFPFTERIGWFQGPCLAISNQHLAPGTALALVVMGEPQKVQQVRTTEQTTSATTCKALMQGRAKMNARPGISFYALETGSVGATDMGIGIVEPPALAVVDGLARADLDQDGQSEVFSSCSTSEGIKFAVWTTKAYQGEPRWSGYYYLGYDLQSTCP